MNKIKMIETLIEKYTCPLLISNETFQGHRNAVEIDANCEDEVLMCQYDAAGNLVLPKWYQQLMQKKDNRYCLLVIKNINEAEERKQIRFKEMMKYAQINRMKLPKNCIIIATHSYLKNQRITDAIMSLFARVD